MWCEKGETVWMLFVRDSGIGFASLTSCSEFQRQSREQQFTGLDVGLALVRRVVIDLGGKIFAARTGGSRATFGFPSRRTTEPGMILDRHHGSCGETETTQHGISWNEPGSNPASCRQ